MKKNLKFSILILIFLSTIGCTVSDYNYHSRPDYFRPDYSRHRQRYPRYREHSRPYRPPHNSPSRPTPRPIPPGPPPKIR